ncbi:MAG TPA: hypothetical protein VGR45_08965, partial [Stellaceae bacterium]|nr:hypothetical protein [Stellaceae bacterium]
GIYNANGATFSPNNWLVVTTTAANTDYSRLQVLPINFFKHASGNPTPLCLQETGGGSWLWANTTTATLNGTQLANICAAKNVWLYGNQNLTGASLNSSNGILDEMLAGISASGQVLNETYCGSTVRFTNGSSAQQEFLGNTAPAGCWVKVMQAGSGTITLTAQTGGNLNGTPSGTLGMTQNKACYAEVFDQNTTNTAADWFTTGC